MMIWLLMSLSVFFYIWNVKYHLESWSAISAFLEICKLRQVWLDPKNSCTTETANLTKMAQAEDLPLGEDCLNYTVKELKPAPRSTAFDIFALISGGLGVLATILAMCLSSTMPDSTTSIHNFEDFELVS